MDLSTSQFVQGLQAPKFPDGSLEWFAQSSFVYGVGARLYAIVETRHPDMMADLVDAFDRGDTSAFRSGMVEAARRQKQSLDDWSETHILALAKDLAESEGPRIELLIECSDNYWPARWGVTDEINIWKRIARDEFQLREIADSHREGLRAGFRAALKLERRATSWDGSPASLLQLLTETSLKLDAAGREGCQKHYRIWIEYAELKAKRPRKE